MNRHIHIKTKDGDEFLEVVGGEFSPRSGEDFITEGKWLWRVSRDANANTNTPSFFSLDEYETIVIPNHNIRFMGKLGPSSFLVKRLTRAINHEEIT